MVKQILKVCNFCGFKQYTNRNPKACPRCHNSYSKKPQNKSRRFYK